MALNPFVKLKKERNSSSLIFFFFSLLINTKTIGGNQVSNNVLNKLIHTTQGFLTASKT